MNVMEHLKFERVETERFNAFLYQTISFVFWFLGMILIQLPLDNLMLAITSIITALFGLMFIYASIKLFNVFKKIKKDPELQRALMNEMYLSYDYKAVATGFYSTMIFAIILFFLSSYIDLSVKVVAMAIIYVQVVTTGVHRLFLYKQ